MVLPTTHAAAAAAAANPPRETRRRSPLLAGLGLAALCLGAAAYASSMYDGASDEPTAANSPSARRLDVAQEVGDLPPVELGAVVEEAEVDVLGPSSAEPPVGDEVSLIAQQ